MGRAPCCDKANVKKGPWSPEEDAKLKSYIEKHGTGGNWIALPQKIGLKRCGKSCRLRWLNYLRPNIKHGGFSEEEDNIICNLYISIGSRWSIIAAQLPGRTDNDIKNYWNTRLKKKLLGKQRKEHQLARRGGNLLKQEIKKGNKNGGNSIVVDPLPSNFNNSNDINPYFPQLPTIPPPILQYNSSNGNHQSINTNSHDAIKKFLIKIGERFSEEDNVNIIDENHHHHGLNNSNFQFGQLYEPSLNIPCSSSSSTSMDHVFNSSSNPQLFAQTLYSTDDGSGNFQVLQSQANNFKGELIEEMGYGNSLERLDGLEFFYGGEYVIKDRSNETSTNGESTGWGDMMHNSMVCPPLNPNYENIQQGLVQECAFDDLSYPEMK